MNHTLMQFVNFLKLLPLSKKISIAFMIMLLAAGFSFMFVLANQVEYRVLFSSLSAKDADAIITKLKEKNVPYKIEGSGSLISVPADMVYELRLRLVGEGVLKDGQVGFEIFDRTDFKTTQFVQGLNYQRALQGELARTINNFKEVASARVFIVLPKESLFVEDKKPASASILLDLKSNLPAERLSAIIHLVAGAVEGLEPEQVTVVDTKGRVIFKGGNSSQAGALLSHTQLEHKSNVESEISRNVQSMLEGIVGTGNAIVRVNAEIDFNKMSLNEEEFDPATVVVRSKRDIEESSQSGSATAETAQDVVNQRTGILPSQAQSQNGRSKKDILTNYEINKTTRETIKPAGTVKRLSVAAVIDGSYETQKMPDGTVKRNYIARNEEELSKFEEIVKSAMGYNEDREDRISVKSLPFSETVPNEGPLETGPIAFDFTTLLKDYQKPVINLFLIIAAFFLLVKPLLNSLKNMGKGTLVNVKELSTSVMENKQLSGPNPSDTRTRALEIVRGNPEKTEQLIRGWIGE